MAGNNSINGQETVAFTDNMSFDGTERGGKLDTDGQVWMGSSTSPNVRKAVLTSDSSLSVTYSEPTSTTAQLEMSINGPVSVANGGTGKSSATAYTVQCGGTTTTAPLQSIAAVGASDTVLTSNGAAALPTFQTSPSGSSGPIFISSVTIDDDAAVEFTSGISSTYNIYMFVFDNLKSAAVGNIVRVRTSSNAGVSYDSGASDYSYGFLKAIATVSGASSNGTDEIDTRVFINASSGSRGSGFFYLYNPSTSNNTYLDWVFNGTHETASACQTGSGSRLSTTPVDAIQFRGNSSNFLVGTVSMYGFVTPS